MTDPIIRSQSINKLYVKIIDQDCKTVCFTSVGLKEGITTIATLTAKAAASYGRKVLYCDFGNYNTSLSKELNIEIAHTDEDFLELSKNNIHFIEHFGFDLITLPGPRPLDTSLIKKERLETFFNALKKKYELIIIDAHCYNKYQPYTLPSKLLCEVVDATVLVILSGAVTVNEVKETATEMLHTGAKILGCVMNDRDYPRLVDELCKVSTRLDKYFPKKAELIRQKLRESVILNTEI